MDYRSSWRAAAKASDLVVLSSVQEEPREFSHVFYFFTPTIARRESEISKRVSVKPALAK